MRRRRSETGERREAESEDKGELSRSFSFCTSFKQKQLRFSNFWGLKLLMMNLRFPFPVEKNMFSKIKQV